MTSKERVGAPELVPFSKASKSLTCPTFGCEQATVNVRVNGRVIDEGIVEVTVQRLSEVLSDGTVPGLGPCPRNNISSSSRYFTLDPLILSNATIPEYNTRTRSRTERIREHFEEGGRDCMVVKLGSPRETGVQKAGRNLGSGYRNYFFLVLLLAGQSFW